jgi:hypothetical protein
MDIWCRGGFTFVLRESKGRLLYFAADGFADEATFKSKNHLCNESPGA